MPFHVMSAIRALRDLESLTLPEFGVGVALALRTNAEAKCWPSYARIAKDARVSRRTAIACVARLEEAGILRREAVRDACGDSAPNVYVFTVGVVQEDHHPVHEDHHGGAARSPGVVIQAHGGGDPPAPKVPHRSPPVEVREGARARTLTPVPESIEVDEEVRMRCAEVGARVPDPEMVSAFLGNARSRGLAFADWKAALAQWSRRERQFEQRRGAPAKSKAPGIQLDAEPWTPDGTEGGR